MLKEYERTCQAKELEFEEEIAKQKNIQQEL